MKGKNGSIEAKWVLIIPSLLISFAIIFLLTPFGSNELEQTNSNKGSGAYHVAPLYTLTDGEWDIAVNSKTIDDATTTCSTPTTEGIHHVMYCDKLAGSDTELSFTTLFKSRVKNYKITEIKTIEHREIKRVATDYKEFECSEEYKLNKTCHDYVWEDREFVWYETIEAPLSTKVLDNNWELTSKREYVKDEKRTYKVEWDDITPTEIKPQTKEVRDGIFRTTFPLVQEFYNELSINPTMKWNYTSNNWGGVASHTELDADNNITATTSAGGSVLTPIDWGWTGLVDETSVVSSIAFNHTLTQDLTFNANTIMSVAGGERSAGDEMTGNISVRIGVGATSVIAYSNLSGLHAVGCYAEWDEKTASTGVYECNLTNWKFTPSVSEIVFPSGSTIWFFGNGTVTIHDDNVFYRRNNADVNPKSSYWYDAESDFDSPTQQARDIYFTIYESALGGSTYASSGNRTLDGFCPNAFDIYEVTGAGLTQVGNDANNYAGMTIKTANDNSTWANELSYLDIAGVQASCFQMIPNVTTDTTTTPRISSVYIEYKSIKAPDIYITKPQDGATYFVNTSMDLNYTIIDPDGISWVGYSLNAGVTNTTITSYLLNTTFTPASGSNTLYVYANDSDNNYNSTSVTFTAEFIPTIPVQIAPANNSAHSSIPKLWVNNSQDTDGDTLYYYFELANLSDFLIVDRASGNVLETTTNTSWTPTYIADGNYSWRVLATDLTTNSTWGNTSTFTYDATNPIVHDIGNVTDLITTSLPVKSAINITASDTNLRNCWYYTSDSSTEVLIDCNSAVYSEISWATAGAKSIYGCANDSAGNEACRQENLMIDYYSVSQSATPTITSEGGLVRFNLTLSKTGMESQFPDTYAILNINNTEYISSKTSFANGSQFIKNLYIPDGWGNTTGISQNWNWSFAIYNSTSTLANTTTSSSSLVVYDAGLDNCSLYGNIILTFNLYDEEFKTSADSNISIETTATLMNPTNSQILFNYSTSSNESTLNICASNEFLNHTAFNLSTITKYQFQAHVVEYHYINNYNQSKYSKQIIPLYDLKTADSTSFLLSFRDELYLPVEGAVIEVWRYYVDEGIYRSVEHSKTDINGEAIAHLVTEDVKYIFKVRKNNVLLYTSPEYLAVCQTTPCQINLRESVTAVVYEDFDKVDNLEYSIETDKDARLVTLSFSTDDGSTSTMNMNVTLSNQYYNNTICQETLTSSGGTLSCTIPVTNTNSTYDIWVWKDGEFIAFDSFSLMPDAQDVFGGTGMILVVMIIVTLPLMAVTSGIAMIIFSLLGIILAGLLTLLSGGSILGQGSTLIWILCAGIIIIVKISKRRGA